MVNQRPRPLFLTLSLIIFSAFLSGCTGIIKEKDNNRPILLKTEVATQKQLESEVDRMARVASMRAKMDLKFEDNSFAELGIAEKYRTADGELVVQRPAKILLKIQAPIAVASVDVAQMTSDGEKFRVAVLNDGGSGKNRKFILGTNSADYSILQTSAETGNGASGEDKEMLKKVSAFANIRPQHFTEALLVRPIDTANRIYVQSSTFQEEEDAAKPKKSPLRRVLRGYYLLDEVSRDAAGNSRIERRFWFDRVGGIRLARQQVFDARGEIEADIVYGIEGNLTDTGEYNNLPLQIEVTRPKEKYKMRLKYQSPESVTIGKTYKPDLFVLQNDKNLPVVDLDQKLREAREKSPLEQNSNSSTRSKQ